MAGADRSGRCRSGWTPFVGWIACAIVVGCLDPVAGRVTAGEHLWVLHVSGGAYGAHVQLIAIGDREDGGRRTFRSIPSRAWDGTATNDFGRLEARAIDTAGLRWALWWPDGSAGRIELQQTGDTATGSLMLPGGARYAVFGVRFGAAAEHLPVAPLGAVGADSTPAILIRVDDAAASDTDFLQRVAARGLPAEIAVPTRVIGQPGRLTWEHLRRWKARGMSIAMHSREHRRTSADAQYFIGEIVGGFGDLADRGLRSSVFVEPGSWGDSILFDSPQKLRTWRGALLRTFASVSECYAYPYAVSFARADSFALGLSHATISDGLTEPQIRALWVGALRPHVATVFLVHTFRLRTPGQLDWFLDLVAGAASTGSVRVASDATQLFVFAETARVQRP